MKNQNKILMSLLTASVSALASAPALAQELNNKEQIKSVEAINNDYIDFKYVLNGYEQLTNEQVLLKNDIKAQVEAMLTKKAPIMKISESINIIVDSYAKNDETIKQQVFDDLQLGAAGTYCAEAALGKDSTCITIGNKGDRVNTNPRSGAQCHATCHTACHGACHGARGWR